MKLVIVRYRAGNAVSIQYALERLGVSAKWTNDPGAIRAADGVIFPGQGEASGAMEDLKQTGLEDVLRSLEQPFLGICLGLQLMCKATEEGPVDTLNLLPERVRRFPEAPQPVPHMGWNQMAVLEHDPLLKGLGNKDWFYYVHSYYAETGSDTLASCSYNGVEFSAVLRRGKHWAVQFHPEKSATSGQQLLENFLQICRAESTVRV